MRKLCLALILFLSLTLSANAQSGLFIAPSSSSITSPVTGQSWLFNSTNKTVNVYNGSSFQTVSAPFSNYLATTNPTSSNDGTQGYVVGSLWVNQTTQGVFMCTNNATSDAVWTGINAVVTTIPLNDLQQGGATNGQSLIWNNTAGVWNPGNPAIALSQLTQGGATSGQVVTWNGTSYAPANAGAGTVTNFSAGNLSPLFTSSVATSTSTPALTFSLSNAAAHSLLCNTSGSSGLPSYNVLSLTAGTGLTGGGNLTASPTISLSTPVAVANGGTGVSSTIAAHNYFGNNTGSSATPSFVTIAAGDLPSTTVNSVSNTASVLSTAISGQALNISYSGTALPVANGGTGAASGTAAINNLITGTPTSGQALEYNGTNWVPATLTGTGTVTSVALTGDGTVFNSSVSGSPVTAAGTLSPSLHTQTANTILSGPASGSAATPTFRFLTATDLPSSAVNTTGNLNPLFNSSISGQALSFTQQTAASHSIFSVIGGSTAAPAFNVLSLTAGTGLSGGGDLATSPTVSLTIPVVISSGGTGLTTTPTDGQLLIGNSNTNSYDLATLTGGTGISVTNGHGTSTISLNSPVAVANGGTGTNLFTSGQATFASAGSVSVSDTSITSSSIIVVTQVGTTPLAAEYSVAVTPGTGFTIYSTNVASTATVNYIRVK